jgi:tripartite ATP-independent transporter DctM subunit
MLLTAMFTILILMLLLGFPVYLCLIGASIAYISLNPDLNLLLVVQRVVTAPDSFTLLAVPFFILAGLIMNTGGVTDRIFKFARNLVGHFRGGLGYVNVLASIIFAGMSGSALADAGGLGLVEIKAMRDDGYDDEFSIGVTASSSTIGPIIPPSIPFVIYGAMANVSVGGLFIGGIIPGLLMGLTLSVMVYVLARKRNYPKARRATLRELVASFKESYLALFMPLIIIGGIWFGFFTPTESAFVSILYALIVTGFVYRELSGRDVLNMMVDTVRMVAPAIMIVAGASLFGWIMNYEKVDKLLLNLILGITTEKWAILLIINILLLFLGMFLEVIAVIMLMLPLLMPITQLIGVHPIHLGVILVLNLMIGLLTPPVGFVLYILSSTTKRSFNFVVKATMPWLIPLIVALMLITYIPELVLFLPGLLGFL